MAKNTALGAEKSKKRTPPKPYSEDTLLSAMETAGNQEFDANVNHFFTLLGKMFFTPYGKEFFTSLSKQIFTS